MGLLKNRIHVILSAAKNLFDLVPQYSQTLHFAQGDSQLGFFNSPVIH